MRALTRLETQIAEREKRDRLFPRQLFADPAWDLLLGLYRARLLGRTVGMEDASAIGGVPENVVSRWLRVLEREGLVNFSDLEGGQRVELTGRALEAFSAYFKGS